MNARTSLYTLTLMATLGQSSVTPALAIYSHSLGANYSMVGGIIAVYAAAQLVTQVPIGRLSDKIGRRKLIVGAFTASILIALMYNFARTPVHLFILQAVAGLVIGCLWPPMMAQLADLTPLNQRGKIMGTFNTLFFIGIGTGPIIGGYVSSVYGFASVFNVWAIVASTGALVGLLTFKELTKTASTLAAEPIPGVKKDKIKLLKPGYWPTFIAACVVRARGGLCQSFNNSMLPLYALSLFQATQRQIGGLMSIHAVMLALFNLPGGMLSDRWGRKVLAISGSLVATVGVIWYSFPQGYWTLFIAVGLAGAGAAFSTPSLAALTGDVCNPQRRGEAYGYFLTSFQLGIITGALVYGVLADLIGLRASVMTWGIGSLTLSLAGFLLKETLVQKTQPVVIKTTVSDSVE